MCGFLTGHDDGGDERYREESESDEWYSGGSEEKKNENETQMSGKLRELYIHKNSRKEKGGDKVSNEDFKKKRTFCPLFLHKESGRGWEIRTPDLLHPKQAP